MTNRSEPITIDNHSLSVSLNVESAPRGMIMRELVQNAAEAPTSPGEGKTRKVHIDAVEVIDPNTQEPFPALKLSVSNRCVGMTRDELRRSTDLSSTINKKHTGKDNRGEGLKVSALAFNKLGLRIRNRKNGDLMEVFLYHENGIYVRALDDSGSPVYGPMDVTDADQKRYREHFGNGDFYEVTLFGQSPEHATIFHLYDDVSKDAKAEVGFEIGKRYWTLPKAQHGNTQVVFQGRDVSVTPPWEPFRAAGHSSFSTISGLLGSHKRDFKHNEIVDAGNGVRIRYVECGLREDRTPYRTRSMIRNNRIAIEWKGEMYDVSESHQWAAKASHFGVAGLHKTLSIIIHLPPEYDVADDRYRNELTDSSKNVVKAIDFQKQVYACQPQWLKKLLEQRDMSSAADVRCEVQAYADSLMQMAKIDDQGSAYQVRKERVGGKGTATSSQTVRRSPRSIPADDGTKRAPKAPEITWTDTNVIPELEHRFASFASSAPVQTLFLCRLHPLVKGLQEQAVASYERSDGHPMSDEIKQYVLEAVEHHFALTVGKAVVNAEFNRGKRGWPSDAVDRMISSESLHLTAMGERDAVDGVKKRLGRMAKFQEARRLQRAA